MRCWTQGLQLSLLLEQPLEVGLLVPDQLLSLLDLQDQVVPHLLGHLAAGVLCFALNHAGPALLNDLLGEQQRRTDVFLEAGKRIQVLILNAGFHVLF